MTQPIYAKTTRSPWRMLLIVACTLLIPLASAVPARAASINSVWFRWSYANNGSIVVGYSMSCRATHSLGVSEQYPTLQDLGEWRWGPINGTEERYAATNVYPDVRDHGGSGLLVHLECADSVSDYYSANYYVDTVPSPSGPQVTWWRLRE